MRSNRASMPMATINSDRIAQVRARRSLVVRAAANVEQLRGARAAVEELIKSKHCSPVLVRLGFHDAGTYDKNISSWPACGGATGSIRLGPELSHDANKGLGGAIGLIEPIKAAFPAVSYADLFQMASAVAVEVAGGPKIPMRYGRRDVTDPADCSKDGNLPDAGPPFHDRANSMADHLRGIFHRMGLSDQEIVALSGAHTLGRARPERSGFGKETSKYTKDGPGTPGGQAWTVNWLTFDNSYFKVTKDPTDPELLVLPSDAVMFEDEGFRPFAQKYADDQDVFFSDYAAAHLKLSELGASWDGEPVVL